MAIPLLKYAPSSQNQRVNGFEVGSDEQPRIFSLDNVLSATDMDNFIKAAYRQIFFHAFDSDRERFLESQLRIGHINARDFIRGLVLSDTYRRSFYELNSNYRYVEQTVQRVLGRDVYSEQEKIAWSIVVATKGTQGFIDDLINTDEYLSNFGYMTIPYQRRRVLPSQAAEIPFNIQSPRYDAYHRSKLGFPQNIWQTVVRKFVPQDQQAKVGDPSMFLNMARRINPKGNTPQRVSAFNINIEASVPRRN